MLNKHGFAWKWDTRVEGNVLHCTCTLSHKAGHKETADFPCPIDGSPAMTMAQKTKGTLTFAMRVSLMQVLGLTDAETDVDGVGPAGADEPVSTVDAKQASTIREWLDQLPPEVETKLLGAYSVSMVSELPGSAYAAIVKRLREKVEAK